jgi:Domain of unknown function (DUF4832)
MMSLHIKPATVLSEDKIVAESAAALVRVTAALQQDDANVVDGHYEENVNLIMNNICRNFVPEQQHRQKRQAYSRRLPASAPSYYYVTNSSSAFRPRNNYDTTLGNPMRGLFPNPEWISYKDWTPNLPASLADFKWAWDKFMINDPDVVGERLAFNWSFIEGRLQQAASRGLHGVISFFIHWPGEPFYIPTYLLRPPYNLQFMKNGTQIYYDQPVLKKAIRQTINALGRRYDGDKRIFIFQAGFTGYWGEWHTYGCDFNSTTSCLPPSVNEEVLRWYASSFKKTHVSVRYPEYTRAYQEGFAYFDASFTYSTLNGTYNGGNNDEAWWFFWNLAIMYNVSDFWTFAPMGGEVRPENQNVFADDYRAGTKNRQDFNACVDVTHATHMGFFHAWQANGYTGINGTELQRARAAASRMGYSFEIDTVAVAATSSSSRKVNMDVTIKQTGVAPFYYPLNLTLYSVDANATLSTSRINMSALVNRNSTLVVRLANVRLIPECANVVQVEFRLESRYLYSSRPIKWAQGTNNGRVIVAIPSSPACAPRRGPTRRPVRIRRPI